MSGINTDLSGQTLDGRDFRRGQINLLRARLGLLGEKDKVLMTMYLENGSSFRQIARLRGVCETSVARRVHQLADRLTDGEFLMCVRSRDKLSPRQMDIARDALLTGLSLKQIAGNKRMSIYAVRKELANVRRLIRKTKPLSSHS